MSDKLIIGISGKKQSGKSTLYEFVKLNKENLFIGDVTIDKVDMADPLKEMIVNIMGVDKKLVYGSEQEKNMLTQYKWKDLPYHNVNQANLRASEYMTGRELMQQVGTNIFRKMNPNIWVDAAINRMKKTEADIVFCCDVRFPEEVMAIKNNGGIVIRLTKRKNNSVASAEHESEKRLDKEVFDWSNFDVIIDNNRMKIEEKNAAFLYAMSKIDLLDSKINGFSYLDGTSHLFAPYFNDKIKNKIKIKQV